MKMGGPEMAPHTPQRSQRPGKAVPLLYSPAHCEGAPKWPHSPQRSQRPGKAVPLL